MKQGLMKERVLTLRKVLEHSDVTQHQAELDFEGIETCLEESGLKQLELVPVHILSGIGAWFATGFFVVFFGVSGLYRNEGLTAIVGAALLGTGVVMSRARLGGVFARQISLSLALTGNAMILVAISKFISEDETAVLLGTQLLICALIYPLSGSYAYRLLAPIGVPVFAIIWMIDENSFEPIHVLVVIEMLLFGFLWLGRVHKRALRPLAYSTACMLPVTLIFIELAQIDAWDEKMDVALWPSTLALALGLCWAYYRLAMSREVLRSPEFLVAVIGTLALGAVATPGILVAAGLLVVGRALGDRWLLALGYLFIPAFLFIYYYAMNVDLASKSWILGGSGLILLVIQQVLVRMAPREERA